jgi:branched-chain amino acid transport system ATP-binding protein
MGLAGLLKKIRGNIHFKGQMVTGWSAPRLVKMGLVLVPEGRQLFPSMSVEDNLRMGAYLLKESKPKLLSRLEEIYEFFPALKERRNQTAGTLSGGEQQMVAIGRGLLCRPELLLLDEPSIGLAPNMVNVIFRVIKRLQKQEVTILLVEQNALAALTIADRGYVLVNGCIQMSDKASNLIQNEVVKRSYLGY